MSDSTIARSAGKLVDRPYFLGDVSGDKGWDCLDSLACFYEGMGVQFPRKFGDWDEKNYPERWKKNPDEGRKVLGDFLRSLGEKIDPKYMVRGDLLIMGGKEIPTFPALYLGNGNVLMVFDKGVKVLPLRFFSKVLIEARRLTR